MRVVSLVPSATETLLAWGLAPVAVTRFCEQPGFPTVGGTKDPDIAAIVALRPDLVVVCDQENRREDADALARAGVRFHAVHITDLAHVRPEMAALADAVGLDAPPCGPDAASATASAPGSASASGSAAGAAPRVDVARRAWIPIWKRPWMTVNGDTYGSSLLASIGVANVAAARHERYPELTLDEAAALAPDVVLAPSEPYPFGPRHVAELSSVAPVVLVDGRDLFWWGARTSAAHERLATLVRPA